MNPLNKLGLLVPLLEWAHLVVAGFSLYLGCETQERKVVDVGIPAANGAMEETAIAPRIPVVIKTHAN